MKINTLETKDFCSMKSLINRFLVMTIMIIILNVAISLCIQNVSFAAPYANNNEIKIESAEDLWWFAKSGTWDFDTKVKLTKDIDMKCSKEKPWIPIPEFYGSFDGNNHTISNLYIKVKKSDKYKYGNDGYYGDFGLFGRILGGGYLKNTTIKNCTIEQDDEAVWQGLRIGVFAGVSDVKVQNCTSIGCKINIKNCNVKRWEYIGGIVGEETTKGTITNCTSNTKISVLNGKYQKRNFSNNSNWNSYVCGGIVGTSSGIIKNCENKGEITNKIGDAGGIVGDYRGEKIIYCNNNGKINVESKEKLVVLAGGIAGGCSTYYGSGSLVINSCGNKASITGKGYKKDGKDDKSGVYLGGIIGALLGHRSNPENFKIINCYSIGNISLNTTYSKVKYNGLIFPCVGYGLGGVVGAAEIESNDSVTISNKYSVGTIQNTGYAGSIFGRLITEWSKDVKISTSNIYHTSSLKDKGNENESFKYMSGNSIKYKKIQSIKTNSTKKSWADMKNVSLVTKLNKSGNIFTYDKYGINRGYPYIKQAENGWKTGNKGKYYFINGVPATGFKTIKGINYQFNKNGVLLMESQPWRG